MTDQEIRDITKETLLKQLQLLSERSKSETDASDLYRMTEAMIDLVKTII